MWHIEEREWGGGKKCLNTIWRRFRQLMIPFLLWSIPLFFVRHNVEHYYEYILTPNLSLWFLWALFFITAIFNMLDWLIEKIRVPKVVVVSVATVALMGLMVVLPDAKLLGAEYIAYYFFFYILGYYMHQYGLVSKLSTFWIVVLAVVWFALAQFWEARETPSILRGMTFVPAIALQTGYRMVTAVIAIFALIGAMERRSDDMSKVSKVVIKLGQVSLGIYAIHMVVRFALVDGIQYLIPGLSYWPLMIITFCMLLPISFFVVWSLGKWSVTSVWLLGKLNK